MWKFGFFGLRVGLGSRAGIGLVVGVESLGDESWKFWGEACGAEIQVL